jgi:hypothetical protein
MLNPTALEKLWARDLESHLLPSRAKDGAISPRLGNRYSRFPLSHRSCYDGFCGQLQREQRPERSQLTYSALVLTVFVFVSLFSL